MYFTTINQGQFTIVNWPNTLSKKLLFWGVERKGNCYGGFTKALIDAKFKGKSNGGTYNIWKSFSGEKSPKQRNLGAGMFLHTYVNSYSLKVNTISCFWRLN